MNALKFAGFPDHVWIDLCLKLPFGINKFAKKAHLAKSKNQLVLLEKQTNYQFMQLKLVYLVKMCLSE